MVLVKDNGFEEKMAFHGQLRDPSSCRSLPVQKDEIVSQRIP